MRLLAAAALTAAGAALAAPCVTPTPACSERIAPGAGAGYTIVYRSQPLATRNESITRALVVVHGAGRDADSYYRSAMAAAFLAGALEDTVVVAPRFASNEKTCKDAMDAGEIVWACLPGPDSWRVGGGSRSDEKVTSFDVADEILRKLARRDSFPNLKLIVVAGHSAGGQFINRYQMSSVVHETLGVPVRYVVANPSAYTYLDALRPTTGAVPADIAAGAPGYTPAIKAPAPFVAFADARHCTTYDKWPYGLADRVGYAARVSTEQLKKQLAERPAAFLLGELDILPLYSFDMTCAAMAQGPTRLARGLAYVKHVNEGYGGKNAGLVIPACGHSARCMFTSERALPLLFPER